MAIHDERRPRAKGLEFSRRSRHSSRADLEESNSDKYREWLTQYMSPVPCAVCGERRLRPESLAVTDRRVFDCGFHGAFACRMRAQQSTRFARQLTPRQLKIAGRPLEEVAERLDFLLAVGLGYLTLDRSAATLSGGEAQRIRLATQIGSRLARRAVRAR